jgi:hypothetical protein
MTDVTVITNNVPRDVVEAWELTPKEREEFDYLDWEAIEEGRDSASFVRYKGEVYDLGEFMLYTGLELELRKWHGICADTFFSGMLIRYPDHYFEQVVVGRYYAS